MNVKKYSTGSEKPLMRRIRQKSREAPEIRVRRANGIHYNIIFARIPPGFHGYSLSILLNFPNFLF